MMEQLPAGKLISYYDGTTSTQIWQGIPVTFSLSIGAAIIWLVFGVLVGASRPSEPAGSRTADHRARPNGRLAAGRLAGIILRYFLAEQRSSVPGRRLRPADDEPWQWFYHLLLPWFTLAILFIGFYGRVLRSNILDTINEDYVRTARAKGLSPRRVMVKHMLRNSLIPIVTLFGLDFAAVLGGGAILTETVYELHGVGFYAAPRSGISICRR